MDLFVLYSYGFKWFKKFESSIIATQNMMPQVDNKSQ